jgi:predicted dehydrogenase
MIRLGVVDFDSSHSVEFTKRLNHRGVSEDQWVDGAQVVAGCVLPSAVTEQARVDQYVRTFSEELGLPLLARPEELIGKVDGVLIESVDGSVHLERARPFIEAGLPVFVDKPFTCSVKDARELLALAEKKKVPIFSSSSLRYAPEVSNFRTGAHHQGKTLGCDAYSPASTHPRNPGFFHYGIHGVETLYAVMGPGCASVSCSTEAGSDVATGRWKDGRIGTMRGIRSGSSGFGFTAFCEEKIVPVTLGTRYIYRELLKQVVEMFRTGKPPLDPRETLEIVAFMEAALQSSAEAGRPVPIAAV